MACVEFRSFETLEAHRPKIRVPIGVSDAVASFHLLLHNFACDKMHETRSGMALHAYPTQQRNSARQCLKQMFRQPRAILI
jgi:hypothetical protein